MAWISSVLEISEPPDYPFYQTTVLLRAVRRGAHKRVQFLLQEGCDPNVSTKAHGVYPLMMACYITDSKKQLSIVNSLLLSGADPSLSDASSRNSLMYACTLTSEAVVKAMVQAADYDLNAVDTSGNTALHYAAIAGRVDVQNVLVRELQRLRLDLNKRNKLFLTPLTSALLSKNVECAKALYKAGASPRFSISEFHRILARISENKSIYRLVYRDVSDSAAVHDAFCTSDSSQSEDCKMSWQQFLQSMGTSTSPLCARGRQRANGGHTRSVSLPSIEQPSPASPNKPSRSRIARKCSLTTRKGISPEEYVQSSANSLHPPSSLEVYHTLMTNYYPAMNSPLFCSTPKDVAEIDSKWIETVNRAFFAGKQPEQKPNAVASSPTDPPKTNQLTRMLSSSTPRSARVHRLQRMTTSPAF